MCYRIHMDLSQSEFEHLVAEGYDLLPQWVRDKISNVALLVEDEPSAEVCECEGLDEHETLLGYYHGIPLSARGDGYGIGATLPDTITLYRIPILEAADDDGIDVRDVVADTIWHEFAHHFGMDEHQVREREKREGKGHHRKDIEKEK
ncbi:MAG: metallopeptidase family protein [Nitrososphaera sp.]|nr:metallopeptidase family protein [Nitrososphaera sp.]